MSPTNDDKKNIPPCPPHCECENHYIFVPTQTKNTRTLPDFPTEIVFKAVFRNIPYVRDRIAHVCAESGINATLTERMSKNYTFVSYTVSAIFPSEDILKMLCARIGNLEGFMLMF